jgi:antitoxin component of RelBE/YafQ-DinJ toxin-antitoxin module
MKLREHAEQAATEIFQNLGLSPSEEQVQEIGDIIEKTVIEAVVETRNRCATAAMHRSETKQDLAHKIAQEIRQSSEILIANLSSLR